MIARLLSRRLIVVLIGALAFAAPLTTAAQAQSATPDAPAAAAPPAAPPGVQTPLAVPPPSSAPALPSTPPPTAVAPAPPAVPPDVGKPVNDPSTGQTLDLTAKPAAYIESKATWDEGFVTLTGAFSLIRSEIDKAGLTADGRPLTVFLETDDAGFTYRAMIPIGAAPGGTTQLTDAVKIGQTPAGKAMKFEHRGSYEEIDSTYEAITAYLDEKGLEAENLFIEEYRNDVKTPDDPTLEVDIYVLLK